MFEWKLYRSSNFFTRRDFLLKGQGLFAAEGISHDIWLFDFSVEQSPGYPDDSALIEQSVASQTDFVRYRSHVNHNIQALVYLNASGFLHCRFFQFGTEIRRCLSGCMAVAEILQETLKIAPPYLTLPSGRVDISHCLQGYQCDNDQLGSVSGGTGVSCFPINVYPSSPAFRQAVRHVLPGVSPKHIDDSFLLGESDDYWLVVLDSVQCLKKIRVNGSRLSLITQRALIVCVPTFKGGVIHGFAFRYFAPQYGLKEGQVSISAAAASLSIIGKMTLQTRLHAVQLSSKGAVMMCHKQCGKWYVCGESRFIYV